MAQEAGLGFPGFKLDLASLDQAKPPEPGFRYDLLILGGGPAAMSAAIYAARRAWWPPPAAALP
jgi:hypothetical protein